VLFLCQTCYSHLFFFLNKNQSNDHLQHTFAQQWPSLPINLLLAHIEICLVHASRNNPSVPLVLHWAFVCLGQGLSFTGHLPAWNNISICRLWLIESFFYINRNINNISEYKFLTICQLQLDIPMPFHYVGPPVAYNKCFSPRPSFC